MRLLPVLTALIVAVVLYALVFERDALRAIVSGQAPPSPSGAAAPAPAAPPSEDEAGQAAIDVIAVESRAQTVDNTVVLRGRTEADRQVEVMSQVSGLVISEPLSKGSFVEAGQVICEVDPGTRPADLQEARAALAEAEIADTAAQRLSKGGYTSETQAVAARASLESARAAVTRAETEIARLTITAPFSGLLETDSAELGSLLQSGAACATVIRLDPVRLVGFLPETQVQQVATGAPARARLADGRLREGIVTFVSRSADATTRTFRVDIQVANPDFSVRDGQTAEIAIEAEGASAHLIPQSALTLDDDGTMGVRVVDAESRARFVAVKILRDTAEGMLVTGLPETAEIITLGQEYVTDGVAVTAHRPEDGA
ncbi:efflux RND transporter periplasmic adaptor subunit [Mangrovicoccus algicola]|uniref:Efflux RND transporter periplasmic adaptor subunit n=1 Tax=Mangrovicoccus algicola TaxID=2771008 RepID=A0A8J7CKA0_9RHOB|nr:efflux RND transporter periplasmic adaptor subunit [Mangrovicoccus algicola]MBE3638506.1 efflux RND transporter periplasmic adaptor subunit [Mangrovicoccus algicola]